MQWTNLSPIFPVADKWLYGYQVCDMSVMVEGPHHRLQEVQKALGGLDNFITILHVNNTTDINSSSGHTDNTLSDNKMDYVIDSQSTHTVLDSQSPHRDSDATQVST